MIECSGEDPVGEATSLINAAFVYRHLLRCFIRGGTERIAAVSIMLLWLILRMASSQVTKFSAPDAISDHKNTETMRYMSAETANPCERKRSVQVEKAKAYLAAQLLPE